MCTLIPEHAHSSPLTFPIFSKLHALALNSPNLASSINIQVVSSLFSRLLWHKLDYRTSSQVSSGYQKFK